MNQIQEKVARQGGADGVRESSAATWPERSMNAEVKLGAVLAGVEADAPAESAQINIRQVACDSRKVQTGAVFFALHGAKADGNAFVRDALERGAAAVVSEEDPPAEFPVKVVWIRVREARKALALAAANFFGHPANALKMVAVTGTNGKTTTTSLIDAMVKASGAKLD